MPKCFIEIIDCKTGKKTIQPMHSFTAQFLAFMHIHLGFTYVFRPRYIDNSQCYLSTLPDACGGNDDFYLVSLSGPGTHRHLPQIIVSKLLSILIVRVRALLTPKTFMVSIISLSSVILKTGQKQVSLYVKLVFCAEVLSLRFLVLLAEIYFPLPKSLNRLTENLSNYTSGSLLTLQQTGYISLCIGF